MTTAEVLDALRRRWHLVFLGLLLTAFVVTGVAGHPGVYSTRAEVMFVAPRAQASAGGSLISSSDSLIATAGLVEQVINSDLPDVASTNQDVDLAGTGIRSGIQVRQPNSGGQWDYNFTLPMLVVQAVGADPAQVARAREQMVRRVLATLRRLQADRGITPEQMITTQVVPAEAPVTYRQGHPTRAAAATALIGVWLTVLLAVGLEQIQARRARRVSVAILHRRSHPDPTLERAGETCI